MSVTRRICVLSTQGFRALLQKPSKHTVLTCQHRTKATLPDYLKFQTNHLTSGDECPSLAADTLRLYSMKWCPFAQRTRLALAHKEIEHEEVNISLVDKPKWLLEKNPAGTVPLIELTDGFKNITTTIIGSLECSEWLEEQYPDSPHIFSPENNPISEAVLHQFNEINNILNSYIYDRIEVSSDRKLADIVDDHLYRIEDSMSDETKFIAGDDVTITDFLLWPTFERLLAKGFTIDSEEMPTLAAWVNNMVNLTAVRNVRNSANGYKKYWDSQKSGQINYDFDSSPAE